MVKLRSEPRIDPATETAGAPGGTAFLLVSRSEGWYEVRLPEGRTAWISDTVSTLEAADDFVRVTVAGNALAAPTGNAETVRQTGVGQLFRRLREQDGWVELRLPRNQVGWLPADSIEPLEERTTAQIGGASSTSPPAGTDPSPDAPPAVQSHSPMTALEEARGQMSAGRLSEAEELLRTLLAMNPENGEARFLLAGLLDQQGKLAEAAAEYTWAADLGFKPIEARQRISEIRQTSGANPPLPPTTTPVQTKEPDFAAEPGLAWLGETIAAWWQVVLGFLLLAGSGVWWWRRRRLARLEGLLQSGRTTDREPPRRRSEVDAKLKSLDSAMAGRLRDLVDNRPQDSAVNAGVENLLVKLDDVRSALSEQQKKINTLTDLLSLQNEKIAALEAENRKLRQLQR